MADKKVQLKEILTALSTPEERKELEFEDKLSLVEKNLNRIENASEERATALMNAILNALKSLENHKKSSNQITEKIVDSFAQFSETLAGKLDELKLGSKSLEGQANFSQTLQQIVAGLSSVDQSIKDKPVPVWRWPQYLYSGLRDTQFSPINPAIAPFGITKEYDYIALTYSGSNIATVTYKKGGASGATVGALSITYSGSNILTVTRTA